MADIGPDTEGDVDMPGIQEPEEDEFTEMTEEMLKEALKEKCGQLERELVAKLKEPVSGRGRFETTSELEVKYGLIREALVREIRDADRWSAVVEGWEALLEVRRQARDLIREQLDDARGHSDSVTSTEPSGSK